VTEYENGGRTAVQLGPRLEPVTVATSYIDKCLRLMLVHSKLELSSVPKQLLGSLQPKFIGMERLYISASVQDDSQVF